MELIAQIQKYIQHPVPLWETALTRQLIQHQWQELESKGFQGCTDYSTARIWLDNPSLESSVKKKVFESTLCIEMSSPLMYPFYNEHGLDLLTENEIETNTSLLKIEKAIAILRLIEPVYDCIIDLVQCVHILRQPDAEIDVSYSHPQIPFSLFLSVCEDDSTISHLRVAESILHEAMHLKLTLIENLVSLIKKNTDSIHYSPWRDEERPVRGVLHGLFVFRAIVEFYNELHKTEKLLEAEGYFRERSIQIKNEIAQLKGFEATLGLTEAGAILAANLLPLN